MTDAGARVYASSCGGVFAALDRKDQAWHDNVPVSQADGPGKHAAGPGADAVSGAAAGQVDRAALGAAFPRTHHVLCA